MTTLRQHQQRAARSPRGTKGKPCTPAQLAARRRNAAKATAARINAINDALSALQGGVAPQ